MKNFAPDSRISHFLNFNIAEQYHVVRNRRQAEFDNKPLIQIPLSHLFEKFKTEQINSKQLFEQICDLKLNWYLHASNQKSVVVP